MDTALEMRPRLPGVAATDRWARLVPWLPAIGAIVLPIGVAAFLVHPKLGALALGGLLAPLLVVSPPHALLLLIAALPVDAVASLGPPGTATLTRLLGFAVMGGWVVHVLLYRERIRLGAPGLWLLAYIAYSAISLLWTQDREAGLSTLRLLVQLFALYVMVVNLLTSWEAIERALDVLLVSSTAVALLALWQLPALGLEDARVTLKVGEEAFNPNQLAAALVLPIFPGLVLGRGSRGWWRACAVVPLFVAALVTGSRGAMVAIAAGALVLVFARPRTALRLVPAALVIVLATVALVPRDRLLLIGDRYEQMMQDRASGRLDIWKVGAEMFEDQPLRGVGLAGFQGSFYRYMTGVELDPRWAREWRNRYGQRGAHNVYLQALAELGVVGAALLLAAIVSHGRAVWSAFRRAGAAWRPHAAAVALAVACTFAVLLVLCANRDLLIVKSAWVVFGFAQAAALVGAGMRRTIPYRHPEPVRRMVA
ncbi:MAG: O-antigen ligase family protein [Thermodesulfobacteriota bacterium]